MKKPCLAAIFVEGNGSFFRLGKMQTFALAYHPKVKTVKYALADCPDTEVLYNQLAFSGTVADMGCDFAALEAFAKAVPAGTLCQTRTIIAFLDDDSAWEAPACLAIDRIDAAARTISFTLTLTGPPEVGTAEITGDYATFTKTPYTF